jgi:hypothetical protein
MASMLSACHPDLSQQDVMTVLNVFADRLTQVNTVDATLKAITMLATNEASTKAKFGLKTMTTTDFAKKSSKSGSVTHSELMKKVSER